MTYCIVHPSQLHGCVTAPPSKSHTMRAILFASMAKGTSYIENVLPSPDTEAMIAACKQLGAQIIRQQNYLIIHGFSGSPQGPTDVINAGNSGQVLRFITCLAALTSHYAVLTGDASLRYQRPLKPLLEALPALGVFCATMKQDDFAPIIVKGPMQSGHAHLSGQDSQPVSGLLIASTLTKGDTIIDVDPVGELPWLQLTLAWFNRLNLPYQHDNYQRFIIPGKSIISAFNYHVVGDFSSLAFPLVAAIITQSNIKINAVDMSDAQGDKQIIEVLQRMGANIRIDLQHNQLSVLPSSQLTGISVDVNNMIDAITLLAVVGCFAMGTTVLYNAKIARSKECDRISAIATELRKMGANIIEREDGLEIQHAPLHGAVLETYHDHRMVMSLVVAALAAKGKSQINDIDIVTKSYPNFFDDMQHLGCDIVQQS